jgi:Periplasmic copper-binding protein (NosD)
MSYTLRGRLDSRVAALVPVLAVAIALAVAQERWWPIEAVALMLGVGLLLDSQAYHRLLTYQPGWAAVPLGALELGLLLLVMRLFGIAAPVAQALALFAGGWLAAQMLGHVGFPLFRLGYAEEGGELGRLGVAAVAMTGIALAGAGVAAYALRPPVVHLAAGVHQGPLVITRREVLVGEPGAVVRGGIIVRADGVTIRDVSVVGGENGITVEYVNGTKLDGVSVAGAKLDGIHVRYADVQIHDCSIDMLGNRLGQGIDISFTMGYGMSMVDGCTVVGGMEGITTHASMIDIARNHVSRTTGTGISIREMAMGTMAENEVRDALGVGLACDDQSICDVRRNTVVDTRPDPSGVLYQRGIGFLASFYSEANLRDNMLSDNPVSVDAVTSSDIRTSG